MNVFLENQLVRRFSVEHAWVSTYCPNATRKHNDHVAIFLWKIPLAFTCVESTQVNASGIFEKSRCWNRDQALVTHTEDEHILFLKLDRIPFSVMFERMQARNYKPHGLWSWNYRKSTRTSLVGRRRRRQPWNLIASAGKGITATKRRNLKSSPRTNSTLT